MKSVELRRVDPATGNLAEYLPDYATVSLLVQLNSAGSLSFDYPSGGYNAQVLLQAGVAGQELAVLIDGVEPVGGRFIVDEAQITEISDSPTTASRPFTGQSYATAILHRACVYPAQNANNQGPDGNYVTDGYSPGQVMLEHINNAITRGVAGFTQLSVSTFTASHDSAGAPWVNATSTNVSYDPNTTLDVVLEDLVNKGYCDFQIVGRSLQIYNFGSLGAQKQTSVVLHAGRDVTESDNKTTGRNVATVALVKGDGGVYAEVVDPLAAGVNGRREAPFSISGITDPATLQAAGQYSLNVVKVPRISKTYGLQLVDPSANPFVDYTIGDYISVDTQLGTNGGPESYRVRQITVKAGQSSSTGAAISAAIVLNDTFDELDVSLQRVLNGLTNGTASATGSAIDVPPADQTIPLPPAGLTASAAIYQNSDGTLGVRMSVAWGIVTKNTDGSRCNDLQLYYLRYRYFALNADGSSGQIPWIVVPTQLTNYEVSGLPTNTQIELQVAANDTSGNLSAWSASFYVAGVADTIAPPDPVAPTVTSALGGLQVTWNGQYINNAVVPIDFNHWEVHVSSVNGFTPSAATLKSSLSSPVGGTTYVSGLVYGVNYYVVIAAVDNSFNTSISNHAAPYQQTGPVQISQVGSGDIGVGSVSAAALGVSFGGLNLLNNSGFEAGASPAVNLLDYSSAGFTANSVGTTGAWQPAYTTTALGSVSPAASGQLYWSMKIPKQTTQQQGYYEAASIAVSGLTIGRSYTFLCLIGTNNYSTAPNINVYASTGSNNANSPNFTPTGNSITNLVYLTFVAGATSGLIYLRADSSADVYVAQAALYNGTKVLPWSTGGQPPIVVPDSANNPIWRWVRSTTDWTLVDASFGGLQAVQVSPSTAVDTRLTQDVVVATAGTYTVGAKVARTSVAGSGAGSGIQLQQLVNGVPGSSATVVRTSLDGTGAAGSGATGNSAGSGAGFGIFRQGTNAFRLEWSTYQLQPGTYRMCLQQGFYGTCTGTTVFDEAQFVQGDILPSYAPEVGEILPGGVQAALSSIAAIDPNSGNLTANSVTANTVAAGAIIAGSATIVGTATVYKALITDLNASKITSGTFSSPVISLGGGNFTTAGLDANGNEITTGSRLDINSAGIQGYAADGSTKTLNFNALAGTVSVLGSIVAGSVIPQSLVGQNMAQNSGFEDSVPSLTNVGLSGTPVPSVGSTVLSWWVLNDLYAAVINQTGSGTADASNAIGGSQSLRLDWTYSSAAGTWQGATVSSQPILVTGGEKYYGAMTSRMNSAATNNNVSLELCFFTDAAGTQPCNDGSLATYRNPTGTIGTNKFRVPITTYTGSSATPTANTLYEGNVLAPASAKSMRIVVWAATSPSATSNGSYSAWIDNVQLTRQLGPSTTQGFGGTITGGTLQTADVTSATRIVITTGKASGFHAPNQPAPQFTTDAIYFYDSAWSAAKPAYMTAGQGTLQLGSGTPSTPTAFTSAGEVQVAYGGVILATNNTGIILGDGNLYPAGISFSASQQSSFYMRDTPGATGYPGLQANNSTILTAYDGSTSKGWGVVDAPNQNYVKFTAILVNASDERLKSNIREINFDPVKVLKNARPRRYTMADKMDHVGLLAQELPKWMVQRSSTTGPDNKEGLLSVPVSTLHGLLHAGLLAVEERVSALENRVTSK